MADLASDPRKPISTGQALDASDTHEDAAKRVPKENINPEVKENKPDEHIVTSDKDKALESAKRGEVRKEGGTN